MSLYIPVNVPIKEYEGKNEGKLTVKKWLIDGKLTVKKSVKWC